MPRRVFITVAEVSGDNNAASFAAALKTLDPSIQLEGLGGPKMAAAGVKIHFETTAGAAMTLHGLKRASEVWRWLKWMKAEYARAKPDLHVCVDSSGFNLHFAKVAKSFGVPVLYYVAPQLWASREGRIKKLRAHVDRLACIFPFEEKWFGERGVNATFVGHPLFDTLPANHSVALPRTRFEQYDPIIGIIPGSRGSEVRANLFPLLQVAKRIIKHFNNATFRIPLTDAGLRAAIRVFNDDKARIGSVEFGFLKNLSGVVRYGGRILVDTNCFDDFVHQCDFCLVKSGTSTVHVAAYGVPMIVVYRVGRLAWHGIGRWLVKTKKIAMVNILAGQTDLVPEFIPWYGSVDAVAGCAIVLV
jgi:lipid-A-disaccharide synthase